jgi:hypothetical protein
VADALAGAVAVLALPSDLDAGDLAHMKKVVGYVHRHMAQKPAHPEGSRWAASLKNWGHDPAKA